MQRSLLNCKALEKSGPLTDANAVTWRSCHRSARRSSLGLSVKSVARPGLDKTTTAGSWASQRCLEQL